MPTPSTRTPVRIARGSYSNLNSSLSDLQDGEIIYAEDQNKLYIKESSSLVLLTPNFASPTFTGDVTFTGAANNIVFDASDNALEFADNAKAVFGTNSDGLEIYHDSNHSYIKDSGTGNLRLLTSSVFTVNNAANSANMILATDGGAVELFHAGNKKLESTLQGIKVIDLQNADTQIAVQNNAGIVGSIYGDGTTDFGLLDGQGHWTVKGIKDGAVELFHNHIKTFETHGEGIKVLSTEGADAAVHIYADEGDDNQDKWKLKAEAGNGEFDIANYAGGSWETSLRCYSNNAVDLYYNGTVTFVTSSTGSTVKSPSHDGGLVVEAINNNQSTNIDIKAKSSGGTVYQKSFSVSRSTGDLSISDGTTTALTIANSTLVSTFRRGVVQIATAVSALDLDLRTSNYFTKTISGNSTFTFSNPAASGTATAFTLELTHSSGTVTWPSSVKWNADTAPTLTAGKTHLFMFVTDDGGSRYRGSALVDYVN